MSNGLHTNDITLLDHRMDIHKNSMNNGHKMEKQNDLSLKRINGSVLNIITSVQCFYKYSIIRRNSKQEANPFDDDHEDWDDYPNDALVDTGEPGVPVRALYDYTGAEADELTFKQGMYLLRKNIMFIHYLIMFVHQVTCLRN